LEVVEDKEKYENILKQETSHPTKKNNILEKQRVYFIKSWFQSIVGQAAMQSYIKCILLNFSSTHFGHAPKSLVKNPTCYLNIEFVPKISCMHEWLHWKSNYT
jgi:hypothetical protein